MQHLIELFSLPSTYISLFMLSVMEIVLGIDNIIFISIVTGKLPEEQQAKARSVGIMLALVFRIALLFGIVWIVGLVHPLFTVYDYPISGRDLILIGGGLFLIAKTTTEIHAKIAAVEDPDRVVARAKFWNIIVQIIFLDIIFSFDSVITAVGLVKEISIMVGAVVVSIVVMLIFSGLISDFVNRNPTIKMLALAFLLLIGVLLFAEGFHNEIPKGYVYFAMAFSVFVEALNMRIRPSKN